MSTSDTVWDCLGEYVDKKSNGWNLFSSFIGNAEDGMGSQSNLLHSFRVFKPLPPNRVPVDDRYRVWVLADLAHIQQQVAPAAEAASGEIQRKATGRFGLGYQGLGNPELLVSFFEMRSHVLALFFVCFFCFFFCLSFL